GTLLVTIDRTTTLLDTAPEPSGPRAPSRWLHPAPTTTASAAITHIQLIRVISAIRGYINSCVFCALSRRPSPFTLFPHVKFRSSRFSRTHSLTNQARDSQTIGPGPECRFQTKWEAPRLSRKLDDTVESAREIGGVRILKVKYAVGH